MAHKPRTAQTGFHLVHKNKIPLSVHFDTANKDVAVARAMQDGYTQVEIGEHLGVSNIAISKIFKMYKAKVNLFNRLRDMGMFWSYSKEIEYDQAGPELFIEYLLKYGEFDDIRLGFELFGKRMMKKIWQARVAGDQRFIRLNVMLARVFFDMDVNADYFSRMKNERFEKLKALTS